jgi:hypothetical protein
MKARVLRPAITITTVMGILVAALAVYSLLTTGAASADSRYLPVFNVVLCNDMGTFAPSATMNGANGTCTTAPGENRAPGAHPDITTTLDQGHPGPASPNDLNFSNVVTLAPNSQIIASGTSMPSGDKIGALHSTTTLGAFNTGCYQTIGVDFLLYNTELPDNPGDPRASGNITFPLPQGTSNRFGHWGAPGDPQPVDVTGFTDSVAIITQSAAGQGTSIVDAASTNPAFQGYPSYLLDTFDPDFVPGLGDNPAGDPTPGGVGVNLKPLQPLAVYGGLHFVVSDWIPLFFVQYNDGDLTALDLTPLNYVTADMGQPSVSVLNDPTSVAAAPSEITDFCAYLAVLTVLKGTSVDGGIDRVTNPAGGTTQFFAQYNASLRDVDQDSYENSLDSCPLVVNIGNPRGTNFAGNGDAEVPGDGIDDACDSLAPYPTATSAAGVEDQDRDAFKNRLDNCPQNPNGVTTTPNGTSTPPVNTPINTGDIFNNEDEISNLAVAADRGPKTDSMGNPCDTGTISISQNGKTVSITLSASVANGRYHAAVGIVAKCILGTDADNDGYCTGNDSFDAAGGANPSRHNAWSAPHAALAAAMDSDQDGRGDGQETWYSECKVLTTTPSPVGATSTPAPTCSASYSAGADAVKSCAQTLGAGAGTNDEAPLDNWAVDFNDDGAVNGNDLLNFANPFGKTVYSGAVNVSGMGVVGIYRFDLNSDGIVNGSDFLVLSSVFGKTCAAAGVPAFTQQ